MSFTRIPYDGMIPSSPTKQCCLEQLLEAFRSSLPDVTTSIVSIPEAHRSCASGGLHTIFFPMKPHSMELHCSMEFHGALYGVLWRLDETPWNLHGKKEKGEYCDSEAVLPLGFVNIGCEDGSKNRNRVLEVISF